MTASVRAALLGLRPAVLLLLLLVLCTGWAAAGGGGDWQAAARLAGPGAAMVAFALCCVVVNDLADERVDRVNLPGDPSRWLASRRLRRAHLRSIAATSAGLALVTAGSVGAGAALVVGAGLLVGTGYSVPPLRLSHRGAVAPLVLPACFVVVPFTVGSLAAGHLPDRGSLPLVLGLYLGFVGRLLLKDFRDVRGDALFGKRTFLVRHGRRPTLLLSACCWTSGALLVLVAVPTGGPTLWTCVGGCVLAVLLLLRRLVTAGRRAQEGIISAVAVVGRGELLLVLGSLLAASEGWAATAAAALLLAITVVTLGQAAQLVRGGPPTPGADTAAARADLAQGRSGRSETISSRPGPTPTAATGAPDSSSTRCT